MSETEIIIRDVQKSDFEEWQSLFDSFLNYTGIKIKEESKKITFDRFLDEKVHMWCAIAIDKESAHPIGFVHYLRQYTTLNVKVKIYIHDLFVRSEYRNKHVGKRLIEFVYDFADRMNTCDVFWACDENNVNAQHLYEKMGFNDGKIIYKRNIVYD